MSMGTIAIEETRSPVMAKLADYAGLTKPRVNALVLVTVAVAAFVADWGPPNPVLLLSTLVGTALVAVSASAFNQWWERESDALMPRTAGRPLPSGRLSAKEVVWFGAITIVVGTLQLALMVNLLTAALGLVTWATYAWAYTPLKSRSSANTAVGAVSGALPVLMGWAAVAPLSLPAYALALILFLWQFPHFMAIAWLYRQQYSAAGLQMLPVVDPSGHRAGAQAVVSALVLIPVSLVPAVLDVAGGWYFAIAMVISVLQFASAVWFAARLDERSARWLLRASLIYLPTLMILLMLGPLV
jgi:protoheme IX farnesyltransferase